MGFRGRNFSLEKFLPDASPSLHSSFTAAAAFHIDPQPPQLDVQAAPRHPEQCGRRPDVASGLPERLKDGLRPLCCARGLAGWRAGEPSPSEAADPPRKREDAVRYWRAVPSRFEASQDVAGPLVAPEQRQRAGRETPHVLAEAAREFQQKMLGQKLNVRHPAAQRRQYESEDVEPIVENPRGRCAGARLPQGSCSSRR